MKKTLYFLALAFVLLPTSWQVFDWNTKTLTVHYGNSAKSPVCFSGNVEDYPGNCTSPAVNNPEYEAKQQAIRQGTWKAK